MVEFDVNKAAVSDMNNNVDDYSVDIQSIDDAGAGGFTRWYFTKWTQQLGYYKQIPEIKSSIDAISKWTIGKGFKANDRTTVLLNNIKGYGEDTFNTILKNMIIVRQIGGDAFAEIVRDKETGVLLNLKPLDTGKMVIVVNEKGIIQHYEQITSSQAKRTKLQTKDVLHLTLGRVASEIHGTSIIDSVENIILMRNEAMADFKTMMHRNVFPLTVIEVAEDNSAKIDALITKYEGIVNTKDILFVPKETVEIKRESLSSSATLNPLPWIQNLSSFFYQAVGIPQIILGGSQEFNEATAKIAYLAFQQTVEDSQRDIEAQLWSQLALKIKLEFPASLENELLSDEKKDGQQGQMNVQPSEMTAGEGR